MIVIITSITDTFNTHIYGKDRDTVTYRIWSRGAARSNALESPHNIHFRLPQIQNPSFCLWIIFNSNENNTKGESKISSKEREMKREKRRLLFLFPLSSSLIPLFSLYNYLYICPLSLSKLRTLVYMFVCVLVCVFVYN